MKTKLYTLHFLFTFLIGTVVLNGQTVCNSETIRFSETFGNFPLTEAYAEGRTGYKFMTGTELVTGEYTVLENAQARPEWHNATDHTGDANGQMMIINPGQADADFYCDSVSGLTTTGFYSVSVYVLNVNKTGTCGATAVLPRIRIEVEYLVGAVSYLQLSSFTSNYIPVSDNPTWIKVTSGFVLPLGVTDIRYRIINSSLGDCGNSLAIDDITFSQCASLTTLPVKGLRINNIEPAGSAIKILFSTETESQTDRMETQKSTDGVNWSTIHTQPAAGSSEQYRAYSATDISSIAPVTYYRIKQTDLKGSISFSTVVKYTTASLYANTLTAYPTPFTSQLNLNFTSQKNEQFTATLYAASGFACQNIMINARKGNNLLQFNTGNLNQGTYLLTLVNRDGTIHLNQKTVKQ